MHILIIPSSYPTDDAPLRGSFFKEQAIALKEAGNDVGIIYSETRRVTGINFNTFKKNHFQVKEYNEDGVRTIRLHGWNILSMRNSLGINLWMKQSLKIFEQYVNKYGRPDIIHVHCGLYGGNVAKNIREKYNVPYVITEHSSIVMNSLLNEYDKKLLSEAYNNADCLISVGSRLRESMMNYTNNEIIVIPNIVDTTIFSYKPSHQRDSFKFVTVCMLKKDKNIKLLLQSFAKSFKGNSTVTLMVIGDGPEKNSLIILSKELGIDSQIEFLGAINRNNLYSYLSKADSFVLPSNYETFGVAYIEALACGLPIITTRCGGPEDFYNEKLGYIIPVDNLEELSVSMERMIAEYDLFNKESISKYIKEKFSKEIIVKKIMKIYYKILN